MTKDILNYKLIMGFPNDSKKFNLMEVYFPFKYKDMEFYVIPKYNEFRSYELCYFNLINKFGLSKGFDKILQVFRDNKSNLPFEYFTIIQNILSKCAEFMHLHFAKVFLKEIIELMFEFLNDFSQKEDKKNFKRDNFNKTLQNMKEMMYKVYLEPDINYKIDYFGVDFGLSCLKSPILDKNLLGLKILCETISEATKGYTSQTGMVYSDKHVPIDILLKKCMSEDIFGMILGSHNQIIQNSGDVMKLLLADTRGIITIQDVENLWNKAQTLDMESKMYTYKILKTNSHSIKEAFNMYFIEQILLLSPEKILMLDLELLINLYGRLMSESKKEQCQKVGDFLLSVYFANIPRSNEFNYFVLDEFEKLLKSWESKRYRGRYLEDILNRILSRSSIFKAFRAVRIIYTTVFYNIDNDDKSQFMNTILDTYNIFENMFRILEDYMTGAFKIIEEKNIPQADIEQVNFSNEIGYNHNAVIAEIFEFLQFITSNIRLNYSEETVMKFFKIFVVKPISNNDINFFFKWINQCYRQSLIPNEVLNEMMFIMAESPEVNLSEMSMELFDCLWGIFLSINKAYKKMGLMDVMMEMKQNMFGNSSSDKESVLLGSDYHKRLGITPPVSIPKPRREPKPKNVDPNIKSDPWSLEGFELIWKLAINSPKENISSHAITNLLSLFFNTFDDSYTKEQIWTKLIEKCICHISKSKDSPPDLKSTHIKNCIKILMLLIEKTEIKGTAGCISHSSILKHSMKVINVTNNLYSVLNLPVDVPANLTLKVFANTTLWDLKKMLGERCRIIPEAIKVSSDSLKDITDNDHGKTLIDLKFKDEENLVISMNKVLESIPRINIIKGRYFTEKAEEAFTEIFSKFSEDGKMDPVSCARFITQAVNTGNIIVPDDKRVKELFFSYDANSDGLIELNEFIQFYLDKFIRDNRVDIVWGNLKNFNYRNDLKKISDPLDEYNSDRKMMPRYILSKNQEFFNVIFSLQDDQDVIAKEASKLLLIISTNPILFKEILILEKLNHFCQSYNILDHDESALHLKYQEIWSEYLDVTNYYKLLYSLQIIDSFFEQLEFNNQETDSEAIEMVILEDKDKVHIKNDQNLYWIELFLSKGGLVFLLNKVLLYRQFNNDTMSSALKKCLNLIMKILKNTFTSLFKVRLNKSKDYLELIRKNSFSKEISEELIELERKVSVDAGTVDAINLPSDISLEDKNTLEENVINALIAKCGKQLSNQINFKHIISKLLEVLYNLISQCYMNYEERLLMNNTLNIFTLIIVSDENPEDILNFVYNTTFEVSNEEITFERIVFLSTLHNENMTTRVAFEKTLYDLSKGLFNQGSTSLTFKLLQIIQAKVINLRDHERKNCLQFFRLYEALIRDALTVPQIENVFNFKALGLNLVDIILTNQNLHKEEEVMFCYLKVINTLITTDQELKSVICYDKDLIRKLINNFLVVEKSTGLNVQTLKRADSPSGSHISGNDNSDIPNDALISISNRKKTERKESKTFIIMYKLLMNLLHDDGSFRMLFESNLSYILNFTTSLSKFNISNYKNNQSEGYVGLKNLGATCYMNSMLQQMFMIPAFRYRLIQANDKKTPLITDKDRNIDDNLLHQIQKMFTFLEMSNRNDYFPGDFCYTFKDFDGNRVNTMIQQDTFEFLTSLTMKLEDSLKETKYKYLTQSIFGGESCTQLICNCGFVKANFTETILFSLDIRGVNTLEKALEKYVIEDKIDNYNCNNCKKKVNLTKRESISKLPNILLIHFQRISFNYEVGANQKINTRVEFPQKLNMKKFTTEDYFEKNKDLFKQNDKPNEEVQHTDIKEEDKKSGDVVEEKEVESQDSKIENRIYDKRNNYYEYELVGIIIHCGHADAGHYYSLINPKRDGVGNKMVDLTNDSNKSLLTFDDSRVSEFNMNLLETECFGGTIEHEEFKEGQDLLTKTINYVSNEINKKENSVSKSAYVLVYERIEKTGVQIVLNQEEKNSFMFKNGLSDANVIKINDTNRFSIAKEYDLFSKSNEDFMINNQSFSKTKDVIFFDEKREEYYISEEFYDYQVNVRFDTYKEVFEDNNMFANDQRIYTTHFSKFIEGLIEKMNNLGKNGAISLALIQDNYQLIFSFITDIIAKSFKENFNKIINNLIDLNVTIPDISKRLLQDFIKTKALVLDLILSSDQTNNGYYKKLVTETIKAGFVSQAKEIELYLSLDENDAAPLTSEIPYAIEFLDYFMSLIPNEISKLWTRMCTYLEIWEDIVKTQNDLIIAYLFKRKFIGKLLDFFLMKDSPLYYNNAYRTEMGNTHVNPTFSPLISTISLLIRYCYTSSWTQKDHLDNICPKTSCNDKVSFYIKFKEIALYLN